MPLTIPIDLRTEPQRMSYFRDIKHMRYMYWILKYVKEGCFKTAQLSGLLYLLSFSFLISKIKGWNSVISPSSLNKKWIGNNFIYLGPPTVFKGIFHTWKWRDTATSEWNQIIIILISTTHYHMVIVIATVLMTTQ